jgi:hypothetical protein
MCLVLQIVVVPWLNSLVQRIRWLTPAQDAHASMVPV